MKNQREIHEALLAGETLLGASGAKYKYDGDELVAIGRDGQTQAISGAFREVENYEIYKEPKWYENIPDGGVLCWVKDDEDEDYVKTPVLINKFLHNRIIASNGGCWKYAIPLTKQEIQVFMDNAPETTGCRHNLLPDNPSSPQYYKCTKCNHVQGAAK